jgi:hypothetical protein
VADHRQRGSPYNIVLGTEESAKGGLDSQRMWRTRLLYLGWFGPFLKVFEELNADLAVRELGRDL